jgi:hypothetical protein
MAFQTPSVRPHRNPPTSTSKYKKHTRTLQNLEPSQADSHPSGHKRTTHNTIPKDATRLIGNNRIPIPIHKSSHLQHERYAQHDPRPATHNEHPTKTTIIHLTETKHSHIKSAWREVLKDYKFIHTHPTLDPTTKRRSGGTILAVRRDTYKEVTTLPTPPHIGDSISAATLAPHDGSTIIVISAYMSQLNNKAKDTIYTEILAWIHTEIISKFSMVTTLMGGDIQAIPTEEAERSYYAPLNQFCKETSLTHITPSEIHIYIPVKLP